MNRIMTTGISSVIMLSLTACATQRYGRETPVSPGERTALTCEQIELEIEKTVGIGNVMEGDAAELSGMERLSELKALQSNKDCPQ